MQVKLIITDSFSFTSAQLPLPQRKSSEIPKVQMFKRKSLHLGVFAVKSAMSRLVLKPTLGQEFEFKVNLLIVLAYCALGWPWHP